MGRKQGRALPTRLPRPIDTALGFTGVWVLMILAYALLGGLQRNLAFLLVLTVVVVVVWCIALRLVRVQQAAGKTLEQLQSMSPGTFEEWVAARFRDLGFSARLTGGQADHGIDLIVDQDGRVAIVQCKNYRVRAVGEPTLRDLYGAMQDFNADRAYLVTTGKLTGPARRWIAGKPIEIWEGDYLVRLSSQSGTAQIESEAPPAATPETINKTSTGSASSPSPVVPVGAKQPQCPKCGREMLVRTNRKSGEPFLGCSGYPSCRYTRSLK
jgi:restriction system protein